MARPSYALESPEQLQPVEVAAGVFVIRGQPGEPAASNLGRTANVAFIIGPTGVLVWNAGVSLRHGGAIVAAIRKLTPQPIRVLILGHAAQDVIFGAAAFAAAGARIWMHRDAEALMQSRCHNCLVELKRLLGEAEMTATGLPRPDHRVSGDETIEIIGRRLHLLDLGNARMPGSLALHDPATGTLLAGDNVMVGRVAETRDADPQGWTRALERFAQLSPRVIIPDHATPGTATDLRATREYLAALEASVSRLVGNGISLVEVQGMAGLPAFSDWAQYEATHARNVHHAYLRIERSLLFR